MAHDRTPPYLYFLAGLTVGTAVGIVLAPLPGEDARKRLTDSARSGRQWLHEAREIFEEGQHLAEEAADVFESGSQVLER